MTVQYESPRLYNTATTIDCANGSWLGNIQGNFSFGKMAAVSPSRSRQLQLSLYVFPWIMEQIK